PDTGASMTTNVATSSPAAIGVKRISRGRSTKWNTSVASRNVTATSAPNAASTPADVGGRPLPAQLAEAQEPEGHRRVEVAAAAPPEGRVHDGGAVGDQLGQRR